MYLIAGSGIEYEVSCCVLLLISAQGQSKLPDKGEIGIPENVFFERGELMTYLIHILKIIV